MENVVLIVHLILALGLIGVVLLQRSEGGGLGLGGGGGGGLVSSRGAATALGKVTWALAIAFICTSLTLTVIAAQKVAAIFCPAQISKVACKGRFVRQHLRSRSKDCFEPSLSFSGRAVDNSRP